MLGFRTRVFYSTSPNRWFILKEIFNAEKIAALQQVRNNRENQRTIGN